jgi:hypothetical protein
VHNGGSKVAAYTNGHYAAHGAVPQQSVPPQHKAQENVKVDKPAQVRVSMHLNRAIRMPVPR